MHLRWGGATPTNASPPLTVPPSAVKAVENNLEIARQIAKKRQLVDLDMHSIMYPDPNNPTDMYEKASTNAEVRRFLLSRGFETEILSPNFTDDYLAKKYPLVIKDQDGNVTTVFHAMVNNGDLPSVYMRDFNAGIRKSLDSGLTPHLASKAIWYAVRTAPALLGGGLFTGAMLQNNAGDATIATFTNN